MRLRTHLSQNLAILCLAFALLVTCKGLAQASSDWTEPFPPFRIAGNLYYVGSKGLANYLITTPQGNILINSDLEANAPLIEASIDKLGFRFKDTKILLISHAHFDHDAGSAKIKQTTGASYMVMDADVPVVESGGKADFQYGNRSDFLYPPTKVDRVLHDGDEVTLGGAVIVGSPYVNPGYKLVRNQNYPRIAEDYERTMRVLKSLPCDIFLGAHSGYF